ncbi:putative aba 3 protein [Mycena sanguinolenta]|uniref:Putative aba 3 protein n=1 Tax=Mycena sanguinolenta TaxID=230812 RepID=A0A8H6YUL7_9AGAR|nr:putative aba 3 protein [Mycena sanguinolenta]
MVSATQLLPQIPSDRWFYPPEIAEGLKAQDIPEQQVDEALVCAWEYARCVIPHWTNWKRYVAFIRLVVIGTVAEFKGELVQVQRGDDILGYNVQELLDTLFLGTPGHAAMCQEFRTFILVTSEKNSKHRTHSELFRRYVNAIASAPRNWFRLRDCDGLGRWTIAVALACNDMDDVWFSEDEWQILGELGLTIYDAVAFYKHRAEGETNSTFAYVNPELRIEAYRMAREVLWALDAAQVTKQPAWRIIINFLRTFGGPIHMTMRRYRFVEQGLTIGMPEDTRMVEETRKNAKLWNRMDGKEAVTHAWDETSYLSALETEEKLMFEGFGDILRQGSAHACKDCSKNSVDLAARQMYQFAGVHLCETCRREWDAYVRAFPHRAAEVFPVLRPLLQVVDLPARCRL